MTTQSHVLERISGNVANVNTTGYKSFDAHLLDTVNHRTPSGTFMSVRSVDIRRTGDQGIIQSTGRDLDVALNGQGYFITNPAFDTSGEQHFTRNGATGSRVADDGNAYLTTADGEYFMGWTAAPDGSIDSTLPLGPIQINNVGGISGNATTAITYAANVDADATSGHNFETRVWSNPDETGQNDPYSLIMTWEPGTVGSNTWTVNYSVRGPDGTSTALTDTTTVTFNGKGQYATPTEDISLTVPFADGSSSTVTMDFSGMTQFGDTGFNEHYQDVNGYSSGTLSSVAFDNFGQLNAQYSNGESRVIAQLAIADFPAPQNLKDVGSSMFTYADDAGIPDIYAIDGALSRSTIIAGSVEGSTVDMAREFTSMITTQKAYSTAATVFRTSDEMIQTISDLKR